MSRLKQAGFDFARLPIDPGPFLFFTGPERTALFGDVAAAVDQIIGAGLSVVLNMQPNDATHHWNSARMVASLQAPSYASYRALAVVFGTMLAARDLGRVALEPANEPGAACDAALWEPLQNDLLGSVRAACPGLTLVATGACGSLIQGLRYFQATALAPLAPILFTIHFYEPYLFTHQGATWMGEPIYRWLTGVPWPAASGTLHATLARIAARMQEDKTADEATKRDAWRRINTVLSEYFAGNPDRAFIDHYLDIAVAWAAKCNIPPQQLLIGEWGALKTNAQYIAADPLDRARYVADVRRSAEARGLPWAMWNAYGGFGLLDDTTRRFDPAITAALDLSVPN